MADAGVHIVLGDEVIGEVRRLQHVQGLPHVAAREAQQGLAPVRGDVDAGGELCIYYTKKIFIHQFKKIVLRWYVDASNK